jgi:hypothetical protein
MKIIIIIIFIFTSSTTLSQSDSLQSNSKPAFRIYPLDFLLGHMYACHDLALGIELKKSQIFHEFKIWGSIPNVFAYAFHNPFGLDYYQKFDYYKGGGIGYKISGLVTKKNMYKKHGPIIGIDAAIGVYQASLSEHRRYVDRSDQKYISEPYYPRALTSSIAVFAGYKFINNFNLSFGIGYAYNRAWSVYTNEVVEFKNTGYYTIFTHPFKTVVDFSFPLNIKKRKK